MNPKVVLTVLDQYVGQVRSASGNKGDEVVGIDLYPQVLDTLRELDRRDVQSVLIAPAGTNVEFEWQLSDKKPIRVVAWQRNLEETLMAIENSLSISVKDGLFVSADRKQRGQAQKRGMHPGPHLSWALWVVDGKDSVLAQIEGEMDHLQRLAHRGECLPYQLEIDSNRSATMIGLMTCASIANAAAMGLSAQVFRFDPTINDLLIARLDKVQDLGKLPGRACILKATDKTALLAIGPDDLEDNFNLHGAHGHYQFLGPSPALLQSSRFKTGEARVAGLLREWPVKDLRADRLDLDRIRIDVPSCPTNAAALEADVRRYTGTTDPGGGPIFSRHTQHADNTRAVNLLVADLNAMGYCAFKFAFNHGGRTLYNVIADLPGRGTIRIKPDLREKLREIFVRFPPWPPRPEPLWRKEVEGLLGREQFAASMLQLNPEVLRLKLERTFDLGAWLPWWLRCPLAGCGAELVLVGCHLDSTAGSDPGYNPATGAAPGVDDDASGITATLAIARAFAGRVREFRHTVRFCFFNAEEQGRIGSQAYAAHLKALDAPVRAVICSDMIGFNSDANATFEIHAGYTDVAVRDLSVPIAERIADWAAALGIPGPAQIYKGTASSGGSDRNLVDGAINRSDHASFHQQGYPAVVVSEDFFVNLPTEPGADPNPNYHRAADTVMDFNYASNIACVIAQAVKELAQ